MLERYELNSKYIIKMNIGIKGIYFVVKYVRDFERYELNSKYIVKMNIGRKGIYFVVLSVKNLFVFNVYRIIK